jgi:zinc transport system permease protein
MSSYLFGDILTVSRMDLWLMLVLNILLVAVTLSFYHHLQAYLFDEEFSTVLGLPVILAESIVYAMIAITVVVLIRVVGIILILALLCVPTSLARFFTHDLASIIKLATMMGAIFCLAGLAVSYWFNIASSATLFYP